MAPAALIETWSLYAVGSLIIFMRIATRWRTVGISGWQADDWIILLSWATYTVMTVAAHIVGGLGDLHALTMEQREALTEEEAAPYVYGTQWFCAGVATYILFIWTLKLNMLFLYQRVVMGLWVERLIKPTMWLVIATFVTTYLILFCACRPYNRMWVVYPDQGPLCQPQSMLNMVPPLIMNLVTDMCIMAIPAPVVIPIKTSLWKRIGLLLLFSAGIFIMIAAILRVTMVLVEKNGPTAAIWSCREDFVAIVVGQAILVRPMFTKGFWTDKYESKTTTFSHTNSKHSGSFQMGGRMNRSKGKDPFSVTAALATVNERGGSTEEIIPNQDESSIAQSDKSNTMTGRDNSISFFRDPENGHGDKNGKLVIHVSQEVQVESKDDHDQHTPQQRVYLDATNDARVWNDEPRRLTVSPFP